STPRRPTAEQRQTAIAAAMEMVYAERPERDRLVETAETMLEEATAFVRDHDLVRVPEEPVHIVLTPEFQRGVAVAYCDPPGSLDRHLPTFYKISPIPENWSDEQADSFLREYNILSMQG